MCPKPRMYSEFLAGNRSCPLDTVDTEKNEQGIWHQQREHSMATSQDKLGAFMLRQEHRREGLLKPRISEGDLGD